MDENALLMWLKWIMAGAQLACLAIMLGLTAAYLDSLLHRKQEIECLQKCLLC